MYAYLTNQYTVLILMIVCGFMYSPWCGGYAHEHSTPGESADDGSVYFSSGFGSGSGAIDFCSEGDVVQCPNEESCIPLYWLCDGFDDCHDGYDESMCDDFAVCSDDDVHVCMNGGTCYTVVGFGVNYCLCPQQFYGPFCEHAIYDGDVCTSDPCDNGGTCYWAPWSNTSYACACPAGWTGNICQYEAVIHEGCLSNPCMNGGTCYGIQGVELTYCVCPFPFYGQFCEIGIGTVCSTLECQNGGTCILSRGDDVSFCLCPYDFTGEFCESAVSDDACNDNPCDNGGTCFSTPWLTTSYACVCPVGWTGDVCQDETVTYEGCSCSPCTNGGTCHDIQGLSTTFCTCPQQFSGQFCEIELCSTTYCQNGGTCIPSFADDASFCVCRFGFTGEFCETANTCSTISCKNGGTCVASVDLSIALCVCPDEFTGEFCEFDVSEAESCAEAGDICKNGATCVETADGVAVCLCAEGWEGDFCDIIDPCGGSPCGDNGVCYGLEEDEFECTCFEGWSGPLCTEGTDNGSPSSSIGIIVGAAVGGLIFLLSTAAVVAVLCRVVARNKSNPTPRLSAGPGPTFSNPEYNTGIKDGNTTKAHIPINTNAGPPDPQARVPSSKPPAYQTAIAMQLLTKEEPKKAAKTPQEEYAYANNIYEEIPDTGEYMVPSQDVNQNGPKGGHEYIVPQS